jgi:N-formylglutamate amidohydrolase
MGASAAEFAPARLVLASIAVSGPFFTLIEPDRAETPVVVEIPHAGLHVPSHCLAQIVAPALSLGRDADLFVDSLYEDAPAEGATLLVGHVSRFVIDLNRAEADVDAECVEGAPAVPRTARGIIWRLSSDGATVLARPLTRAEFEDRVATCYRPYHEALAAALGRKREKFGYAVLLAAHSMPSIGRSAHGDRDVVRADIVPGTQGRTSAAASLIDAVDAHARREGWTVRHDEPYRGGYATQHYGRPEARVHAIQVELARRLYMDERTLRRGPEFARVRAWCRALVAKLGKTAVRGE